MFSLFSLSSSIISQEASQSDGDQGGRGKKEREKKDLLTVFQALDTKTTQLNHKQISGLALHLFFFVFHR